MARFIGVTVFSFFILLDFILAQGSTIENPAYVDLAPCPCDLTDNDCDTNCCCDSGSKPCLALADCTSSSKELFSECISGALGGESLPTATHWCNQSMNTGAPDWSPLLCTVFETNSYLGLFYEVPVLITADGSYPNPSEEYYKFQQISTLLRSTSSVGYKKDYPIQTSSPGYLSLPHRISEGHCVHSPIRYLDSTSSSCTTILTTVQCASPSSALNVNNYIQCSNRNGSACSPAVIQFDGSSTVDVETRFLCATNLTGYIVQQSHDITQSPDYLTNNITRVSDENSSTATCSWDDGISSPPNPSTTPGGDCRDAVIDVNYNIIYNGTLISKVIATYIMADVPLMTGQSQNSILTTKYSVSFSSSEMSNSVKYSGRPGYNLNTALNMATDSSGTLTNHFRPKLPRAGVSGLCEYSDEELVLFPNNQISQCLLEVPNSYVNDCHQLRYDVFQKLELLFPVVRLNQTISRFGTFKLSQKSHWVPVLRNVNTYDEPSITTNGNVSPQTTQVMATNNTSNQVPITIDIQQSCSAVPAAAHLQVLYALTGRSAGFPVYQIVGSTIVVSEDDWIPLCQYGECGTSETTVFPLTFSTEFIEVPSQSPEAEIRYNKERRENCQSCDPPWEFESLFYPIGANIPQQFRAENLALFLFLISSFLLLWIVSRSWWQDHFVI